MELNKRRLSTTSFESVPLSPGVLPTYSRDIQSDLYTSSQINRASLSPKQNEHPHRVEYNRRATTPQAHGFLALGTRGALSAETLCELPPYGISERKETYDCYEGHDDENEKETLGKETLTWERELPDEDEGDDEDDADRYSAYRTRTLFLSRARSWVILCVSVFSFLGSMAYFFIAVSKPEWNGLLNANTSIKSVTAAISVGAKLVEMAFVTTYVVSLGQYFSHSGFGKGTSFADLNVRNWILQPGMLVTPTGGLKDSACSLVGLSTILATIGAIFYGTASQSLVNPELTWTPARNSSINRVARTQFANGSHMSMEETENASPVPDIRLELRLLADSAYDFPNWYLDWFKFNVSMARPAPTSKWKDDYDLHGTWLNFEDPGTNNVSRIVNNATLVYPHVGVIDAAADVSAQQAMQSVEAASLFMVKSSESLAPMVNTLCASVSWGELNYLLESRDRSHRATYHHRNTSQPYDQWRASFLSYDTPDIDELARIFQWSYPHNIPPQFVTHPTVSGLVINEPKVRSPTYMLFGIPDDTDRAMMCRVQGGMSRGCSTMLDQSSRPFNIGVDCGASAWNATDPSLAGKLDERFQHYEGWPKLVNWYLRQSIGGSNHGKTVGAFTSFVGFSLPQYSRLGAGSLPQRAPSFAEGMSVLCGSLALLGSRDSPISVGQYPDHFPVTENLNFVYSKLVYQSGAGAPGVQGLLYGALGVVCVQSTFCVAYLISRLGGRYIRDLSDPHNVFWLGLNSTPTKGLPNGFRESGNKGHTSKWQIMMDEETCTHYVVPVVKNDTKKKDATASSTATEVEQQKERHPVDHSDIGKQRQNALKQYKEVVHRVKEGFIGTYKP